MQMASRLRAQAAAACARSATATTRTHFASGRTLCTTTGTDKAVLIRGGTIVNADREFQGDVLSVGEKIVAVSEGPEGLTAPAGLSVEVIDAGGCYVMPGGIDPQTHMEIPFMGTLSVRQPLRGEKSHQTHQKHPIHTHHCAC